MKKLRAALCLVSWAGLSLAAQLPIEITDFSGLNFPFSAINAGQPRYVPTTDWLHGDTFFGRRKQKVITREMDNRLAYFGDSPAGGEVGRNILEIGTGRGYLTSRIARHLHERRASNADGYLYNDPDVVNPHTGMEYGGAVVMTIDNWQARDAEHIETHGITIPPRQAVGENPENGLVAETDVSQMMSNLLHEATRVGGAENALRNNFLDLIQLPIRNSVQGGCG